MQTKVSNRPLIPENKKPVRVAAGGVEKINKK
jgi:hypothetical protein